MRFFKTYLYLLSAGFFSQEASLFSQPLKVLHYTETTGYDHQTRAVSFAMFKQMGAQYGFSVEHDSTGQTFNSVANLQQYAAVIFANTTGDGILDAVQKQNFEAYLAGGGNFIGIHSASDTYRHSSANGSNTGGWDWYAEMLGASVQENPHHVTGTPVYKINAVTSHALLTGIPDPWSKAEEYYYWEAGYFNPANTVLQKVEQTIGPNMQVNSYDAARPVSWYKLLPGGGRSFYTALGHAVTNYTSDMDFYRLLSNALLWTTGQVVGLPILKNETRLSVFPNPAGDRLWLNNISVPGTLVIYDEQGKIIESFKLQTADTKIALKDYASGIYFLLYTSSQEVFSTKFLKE